MIEHKDWIYVCTPAPDICTFPNPFLNNKLKLKLWDQKAVVVDIGSSHTARSHRLFIKSLAVKLDRRCSLRDTPRHTTAGAAMNAIYSD